MVTPGEPVTNRRYEGDDEREIQVVPRPFLFLLRRRFSCPRSVAGSGRKIRFHVHERDTLAFPISRHVLDEPQIAALQLVHLLFSIRLRRLRRRVLQASLNLVFQIGIIQLRVVRIRVLGRALRWHGR